ncbi:MAG: right-handed parallel beta-helix repeat-containing protein [Planctomycetota bacterium]|jgi:hypothetical protein
MTRQIVLLGIVTACLTLNSTVLATDRLVPSQYPTIQAAIDDCNDGDVVIVEPNTYTGPGNRDIDFKGKAITVRSINTNDPNVVAATVIDCENSGRGFYFHSGEDANSIVAGLTVKNGKIQGTESDFDAYGGGIYCSGASPTILSCSVLNCSVYGYDCTPCEVSSAGEAYGGGISCVSGSHPTIVDCEIRGNLARSPDVIEAMMWSASGYGGGIYCNFNSTVTVYDSIITANTAQGGVGHSDASWISWPSNSYGGGIYINESSISSIKNCLITNNNTVVTVGEDYDGLHYGQSNGAGIYCGYPTTINNCSICDNDTDSTNTGVLGEGGGIYGTPTVEDSIIWANLATNQIQGSASVTYSDVQGGYAGVGNINADPFFVTEPLGDYYLSQVAAGQANDSPCVDAGSDTAVNLGMDICTTRTDEVGDKGIVDMGYHYFISNPADISGECGVDFFDYAIFASQWKQMPGVPSADIVPPGGDGIVNEKDLAFLIKYWLWGK